MTIEYYQKDTYGHTYYFIKDSTIQKHIQALTGKKTVSLSDMNHIASLFQQTTFKQVLP